MSGPCVGCELGGGIEERDRAPGTAASSPGRAQARSARGDVHRHRQRLASHQQQPARMVRSAAAKAPGPLLVRVRSRRVRAARSPRRRVRAHRRAHRAPPPRVPRPARVRRTPRHRTPPTAARHRRGPSARPAVRGPSASRSALGTVRSARRSRQGTHIEGARTGQREAHEHRRCRCQGQRRERQGAQRPRRFPLARRHRGATAHARDGPPAPERHHHVERVAREQAHRSRTHRPAPRVRITHGYRVSTSEMTASYGAPPVRSNVSSVMCRVPSRCIGTGLFPLIPSPSPAPPLDSVRPLRGEARRYRERGQASPPGRRRQHTARYAEARRRVGMGRDVWQRVEEPRRRTWGETTRGEADQPCVVTACARLAPGRALRARSVCGRRNAHSWGRVRQGAAGWPRAVAHPRLPQFRTCPIRAPAGADRGAELRSQPGFPAGPTSRRPAGWRRTGSALTQCVQVPPPPMAFVLA